MLKGADVSFDVDPVPLKVAGLDFALTELMIGTSVNPSGPRNVPKMQTAGLLTSIYVYAIYAKQLADGTWVATDPIAHADAFCDALQKLPPLDFPPALDVEQPKSKTDSTPPLPGPVIVDWCEKYVQRVHDRLGIWMLVYSFPSYEKLLGPAWKGSQILAQCLYWPASYLKAIWAQPGQLPMQLDPKSQYFTGGPWDKYTLWQTAGNVNIPGIPYIIDANVFNGSRGELQALMPGFGPSVEPAPVTPVPPTEPDPNASQKTFWQWVLALIGLGAAAGVGFHLARRK